MAKQKIHTKYSAGFEPATGEYDQFVSNCGTTATVVTDLCWNEVVVFVFVRLRAFDILERISYKNVTFRWPPRHEASTTDAYPGRVGESSKLMHVQETAR